MTLILPTSNPFRNTSCLSLTRPFPNCAFCAKWISSLKKQPTSDIGFRLTQNQPDMSNFVMLEWTITNEGCCTSLKKISFLKIECFETICSVYTLWQIPLWVAILFSLKLACTNINFTTQPYLIKPSLSLYTSLQMQSCITFILSNRCIDRKIALLNMVF